MRRFVVFFVMFILGMNIYAQFDPDDLRWKFLDNMTRREYDDWAGNRNTCSREFRSALSEITNNRRFDLEEFFQITDIGGNDTQDDDQFWVYIFDNYETIIGATISPGDVNIFLAPCLFYEESNITDGYFLVSRYNGGPKNDPESYRLFLYYFQILWM